ncbi:MAG: fibronectin type III domain-containing protein [Proteiniphilum sp.]|nr:fibronectin type III domain-containing protein [Proteiniphilum sp.]
MKKRTVIKLIICFCFVLFTAYIKGQEALPSIKVRSEIDKDKVLLRWAATDAKAWTLLNKYGVILERETIVRDGRVLDEPESVILSGILKPEESDNLKKLANEYPYGAIVAQGLFGEKFEVSGSGEADVAAMIALGQEMQQRYVFSLYAADLCFPVAVEVGWGWEDHTVKENERYLYKVISQVPEDELIIENGALFVDTKNLTGFPKALDFYAGFSDGKVLLSWNYRTLSNLYTAYILERSTDGNSFSPVSEIPITYLESNVADENAPFLYVDTIANDITYHYRIMGITPFGSTGAYSDTLSGKGTAELTNPPFITRAIPDEKGGADVVWTFDEVDERLIENFSIEHSPDNKTFSILNDNIRKNDRYFHIDEIPSTSYYVVTANSVTGKSLRSFPVLIQAADTIPPAVPTGLKAQVDSTGAVHLSWDANTDSDLCGYRVFKANTDGEEFIPLNDIAIQSTSYIDTINISMLNEKAYYTIAALDERYNRSEQSTPIAVIKPSVIPPSAPFIRQVKVENGKNSVYWTSGGEAALKGFYVYRSNGAGEIAKRIATIEDATIQSYEDTEIENGRNTTYRIAAFTGNGLVSDFSIEYSVESIHIKEEGHKTEFTLTPVENGIRIKWSSPARDIISIQLFKSDENGSYTLFRDSLQNNSVIEDTQVVSGIEHKYMLVVKTKGNIPEKIEKNITL